MKDRETFHENRSKRRNRLIAWSVVCVILVLNIGAIVDSVLHPEIEYFDMEHIIVGLTTACIVGIIFVILNLYVARLEKAFQKIHASEETLRENDEKFKHVFDLSVMGKSITQLSGEIDVNQATCDMLGYSREELKNRKWVEFTHPEDVELTQNENNLLVSGQKKKAHFIKRFIHKNGSIVWVELGASIHRDPDGKPLYIISTLNDITERIRAEKITKEFTARNPMSIQILDKDGFTLEVNPAFKLLFGSIPPTDYSIFNDIQLAQKGMGKTFEQLRNGGIVQFPNMNFNVHDSRPELPDVPVWVKTIGFPLSGGDEKPDRFVLMHENITERMQAEEALRQQNQVLNALQNTTLELVSQLDLHTTLENIVKRACALLGTSAGSLDLVDPGTGRLVPQVGVGALEESLHLPVQLGEGLVGIVWQTAEMLVIPDYDQWAGRLDKFSDGVLGSVVGMPLLSGTEVLGVLTTGSAHGVPHDFDGEAIEILNQFARLATVAVQNARLFTNLQNELGERKRAEEELRLSEQIAQRMAGKLQMVNQVGLKITSGLELEQVMQTIYAQCQQIGDTDTFYIAHYEEMNGILSFPFYFKDGERRSLAARNIKENAGLAGKIIESRRLIYIPDESNLPAGFISIRQPGKPTWSFIGVPLIVTDRVVGVLSMQSHRIDAYEPEQIQTLELLATQVAIAIQNARLYETIQKELMERKLAEEELRESEVRFKSFVEQSPVAIGVFNLDGIGLYANQKFLEILGLQGIDEMVGRPAYEFFAPQFREESMKRTQRRLQGFPVPPEYESVAMRADGSQFPVNLAVAPIQLPSGINSIAFLFDISERKKAEEEILQLNVSLEQRVEERTAELEEAQEKIVRQEKLAVLGQVAGSVSHELRNPLGVINNAVYYLDLVQPDANEKIKEHHAMIKQEVGNAEKIISDLLDYARNIGAEPKPVSIPELVQRTLDRFPLPVAVELALKFPANLPQVFADPRQVVQVLGNLTTNACQAMSSTESGMIVRAGSQLTISATRQENMVAIAVKDNGVGIPAGNIIKLFEPLFTTRARGIGLGLAVSKKLAEANGGRIEVESEPGQGATFSLYLPVAED
jgi:PAS domain S-box-containing protein